MAATAVYPAFDVNEYDIAMGHYCRAVTDVRSQILCGQSLAKNSNIETILLSCILFICFEILQGAYDQANQHLKTGLRILDEHLNGDGPSKRVIKLQRFPSKAIATIAHTLIAMDYDLTMSGTVAPYLSILIDGPPDSLATLDEARTHLDVLAHAVFRTRGELAMFTENTLRAAGQLTGDEDRDYCSVEASLRTIDLSSRPELQQSIFEAERKVSVWSDAFASLPKPSSPSDVALHMVSNPYSFDLIDLHLHGRHGNASDDAAFTTQASPYTCLVLKLTSDSLGAAGPIYGRKSRKHYSMKFPTDCATLLGLAPRLHLAR